MDNNASTLIEKYLKGECTPQERSTLLAHFNTYLEQSRDTFSPEDIERLHKLTWEAIYEQTTQSTPKKSTISPFRKWLPYAAAIIFFILGGAILMKYYATDMPLANTDHQEDIFPLGDRAVLTLADGRKVDLDAGQTGIVFSDHGVTYADGSAIHDDDISAVAYRLSTPKGATYNITLPDGTKVWLNGGSEIRYPGRFDDDKRVVELEGEAYFDVEKQYGVPFWVVTEGQEIKVLGTEFNVSGYDPAAVKTTLVEGSVQVMAMSKSGTSLMLIPGEQSVLSANGTLDKKKANLKQELAWRSGLFHFDKTPFSEMMQQVAHWYDVDVYYEAGVPKGTFSGIMDRSISLRTLLDFLSESKHFEFTLEGRQLLIKPKTNKN